MARIDDSALVAQDYADPDRLAMRFRPFRDWHLDGDLDERLARMVADWQPERVLEVGCGDGRFASLLANCTDAQIVCVDATETMVRRASMRGLDAMVGDVRSLPFDDESFDVIVANWMLYHVPNVDQAIAELRRVIKPGGLLVAATMGDNMLDEVWSMVPDDGSTPELGFSEHNGRALLKEQFPCVKKVDLGGRAKFPNRQAVIDYMRATLTRAHLAESLPEFDGPLVARTTNVAFVAQAC